MITFFMALAGMSKEPAAPFLLLLGAAASSAREPALSGERPNTLTLARPRFAPLICGAVLAIALNSAFNWIRFGSILNLGYIGPLSVVPNWSIWANFFTAIWAAPNGGLAVFWPASVLTIAATSVGALRGMTLCEDSSWRTRINHAVPCLAALLLLVSVTAGLACWYSPLGWVAWGPRLILPWVLPSVLLLLFAYGRELDECFEWLGRRPVLWILLLGAVAVASLPQCSVMFNPGMCYDWFHDPEPSPDFRKEPMLVLDPVYFYWWQEYAFWRRKWIFGPAFDAWHSPRVFVIALIDSFSAAVLLPLLPMCRAGEGDRSRQ